MRAAKVASMKTTTKRRGTDFSFLKGILVLGSLLATLIGGDLLAKQNSQPATVGNISTDNNSIVLQDSSISSATLGDAPMVRLIIPDPVTNSKSSK